MTGKEQLENIDTLQAFNAVLVNEVAEAHAATPFEDEREGLERAHAALRVAIREITDVYHIKAHRLRYLER